MSYSSILGADSAPRQPSGRDSELLGPSDNSDSGSDAQGTSEAHADSDAAGTGERASADAADAPESADILPDRVVRLGNKDDPFEADPDGDEFTDLDPDDPAAEADTADS